MNTLHVIFAWITDVSLRASVLAIAVLVVQGVLRGYITARWRYALWFPVPLVLAVPVLPESRWSAENIFVVQPVHAPALNPEVPIVETTEPTVAPSAGSPAPSIDWKGVTACLWAIGAVISLAVGAGGYLAAVCRFQRSVVKASPALLMTVYRLGSILKLRNTPRVIVSSTVESPAVAGLLQPVLLLPADFESAFSKEEIKLVLKHELMHLKRHDLPVNAIVCLLQALHWFNPLLWFAAAKARADRESACDAQVLASDNRDCRNDYGHALLKVQSAYSPHGLSLGFVGIFAKGRAMHDRIAAIANYRQAHPATGLLVALLIVVLSAVGATRAANGAAQAPQQIRLKLEFLELTTAGAGVPTLTSPTQSLAALDIVGDHHGGPIVITDAELTALKSLNGTLNTVSYPPLVTLEDKEVIIKSVVNQPISVEGKEAHLQVGTSCNLTARRIDNDILVDCLFNDSKFRDADGGPKAAKAKSLAEASAFLSSIKFREKIRIGKGKTALVSMRWPDAPASSKNSLVIVAITPSLVVPEDKQPSPEIRKPAAPSAPAVDVSATTEFELGQALFPFGDSIHITSVLRTADSLTVAGEYELVSEDKANLDLYITAKKPQGSVKFDRRQRLEVTKGKGPFILVHPYPHPGMPHVTFYSNSKTGPGRPFGGIYFGSKEEAESSKRMRLSYGKGQ